jgi:hypothetical protein
MAPVKYLLQTLKTLQLLVRKRPGLVLVASPPVVAPGVIWLASKIFGYRFVIDAHSGVFHHRRWIWAAPIQRFLTRRAEATIVTNSHMSDIRPGARRRIVQDISLT